MLQEQICQICFSCRRSPANWPKTDPKGGVILKCVFFTSSWRSPKVIKLKSCYALKKLKGFTYVIIAEFGFSVFFFLVFFYSWSYSARFFRALPRLLDLRLVLRRLSLRFV